MSVSTIVPKNVHLVERALRVLIGVVLISLVFVGPKTLWGWVGLIPLTTGLAGTCPIYTAFGFSTCRLRT